jgi:hypothetical protein
MEAGSISCSKAILIKIASFNGTLRTDADFDVGFNGVSGVTAEGNIAYWSLIVFSGQTFCEGLCRYREDILRSRYPPEYQ